MIYEERRPPEEWREFVTRLWYLEAPRLRPYEKILPLPFVHAIVNLSDPYRLFDRRGQAARVDDAFVSGIQSEYLVIESPASIRHVGIEFTPQGLRAFSAASQTDVAGRVLPADEILPGAARLANTIRQRVDRTPAAALDELERFIRSHRRTGIEPDPVVSIALAGLDDDPRTRIGVLAQRAGVSHKTLVARMRAVCGILPKRYAEVLRFHRFILGLPIGESMSTWAEVVGGSDYYDQPHAIRAFRRFTGVTPTEYLALVRDFGPDAASFVPLDEVPGTVHSVQASPDR